MTWLLGQLWWWVLVSYVVGLVATWFLLVRRRAAATAVTGTRRQRRGRAPARATAEPTESTTEEAEDASELDDASGDATAYGPRSAYPLPDGATPQGFPLKGNVDSLLFHTPDSPRYETVHAEVCFADDEAAIAAGFLHWDAAKR